MQYFWCEKDIDRVMKMYRVWRHSEKMSEKHTESQREQDTMQPSPITPKQASDKEEDRLSGRNIRLASRYIGQLALWHPAVWPWSSRLHAKSNSQTNWNVLLKLYPLPYIRFFQPTWEGMSYIGEVSSLTDYI